MYVIIVYDVRAERTDTIRKFLRKWLNWRQNSVFEGELTESEYQEVKNEIAQFTEEDESVVVFRISGPDFVDIDSFGEEFEDRTHL